MRAVSTTVETTIARKQLVDDDVRDANGDPVAYGELELIGRFDIRVDLKTTALDDAGRITEQKLREVVVVVRDFTECEDTQRMTLSLDAADALDSLIGELFNATARS